MTIQAPKVQVLAGGEINSSTKGDGKAGQVTLAVDNLTVDGMGKPTTIQSSSEGVGGGGHVVIEAERVELISGGLISTSTKKEAEGGVVQLSANNLTVDGQGSGARTGIVSEAYGRGNAGEVSITGPEIRVLAGGEISTSTSGDGRAGDLLVLANHLKVSSGGRVAVEANADGDGGQMTIRANDVEVSQEGILSASTHGAGRGGDVDLDVDQLLVSEKGRIESASTGVGNSGSVNMKAKRIWMNTGGSITTEASKSSGGSIALQLEEELSMTDATLTAQARGDGGLVTIQTPGEVWLTGSRVSAEAGEDGGNITISKPALLLMNRGQLSANAVYGEGGYIQLAAEAFLPSTDTAITASSEYGAQGTVEIRTPDTDAGSALVVLPETLVSRNINLAERCALRLADDLSSFFLNGQGGIPVWASQGYLPTVIVPELGDTNSPSDRGDAK